MVKNNGTSNDAQKTGYPILIEWTVSVLPFNAGNALIVNTDSGMTMIKAHRMDTVVHRCRGDSQRFAANVSTTETPINVPIKITRAGKACLTVVGPEKISNIAHRQATKPPSMDKDAAATNAQRCRDFE